MVLSIEIAGNSWRLAKGPLCAEPMLEDGQELVFATSSWMRTRSSLDGEMQNAWSGVDVDPQSASFRTTQRVVAGQRDSVSASWSGTHSKL